MAAHRTKAGHAVAGAVPAPRGSVERALRLLEAVDRKVYGAAVEELADEVGMTVETTRRLLRPLEREGYLERLSDGGYMLGGALALLGQVHREQMVQSRLLAKLASLRDELGAAVYFARYADGEIDVQAVVDSADAPSVHEWVDFRASGHASAVGKCLLAQLDHDARRDHLSRHPAARFTSRTTVDAEAVLHSLDRHPATVPVLDLQEYALGSVCAAVPVTAGSAVGCLALSLPLAEAHRLRPAAELLAARAAPVLLALTL